ncbi:MAG: hypothetical protein ILP12_02525 [Lachnospiraceae bacterium]|nr:hypothetical protein [Lachnospiraceae bacterium]
MNPEDLRSGLAALSLSSARNGGSVTVGEIVAAFPGFELNREQIAAVYEYLAQEGIRVADYVPHDTASIGLGEWEASQALREIDPREQAVYEMYLEDVAALPRLSDEETAVLLRQLQQARMPALRELRDRVTTGNLYRVLPLALQYAGRGAALGDLIQEGNLALVRTVGEAASREMSPEELLRGAEEAMRELVQEQGLFDRAGDRMAQDANRILDLTRQLEEEEGREATAEELAEKLGLSVARVDEVLRESALAIKNREH